MRPLRIGSRGSALALWQANHIAARLKELHGATPEIVVIRTSGDHFQDAEVAKIGVKGVFIKEIEDALLEGRVDVAVHSIKDLPTELPAGLALTAIPQREDPRDCLLSRNGVTLANLPARAQVGTSSVRRQAQLRRARPDLHFAELRGNVDTRIRKLEGGDYDAIVLAKAGLSRLGLGGKITETLSTDVCLPAVGQGALGIETRAEDAAANRAVSMLDHDETRVCVTAERLVLDAMQGGCQMPLGAWARIENGALKMDACIVSTDGSDYIRAQATGAANESQQVASSVARQLFDAGAERILKLAGRDVAHG